MFKLEKKRVNSMLVFPQPYLGALLSSFSRIGVLFTYLPPKLTHSWAGELGHIQFETCFPSSASVPPTPDVYQSPQALCLRGPHLSLGGTFHQVPLTQTLLSGVRVGILLQGCPAYPAEDLDWNIVLLEGEN